MLRLSARALDLGIIERPAKFLDDVEAQHRELGVGRDRVVGPRWRET